MAAWSRLGPSLLLVFCAWSLGRWQNGFVVGEIPFDSQRLDVLTPPVQGANPELAGNVTSSKRGNRGRGVLFVQVGLGREIAVQVELVDVQVQAQ